MDATRAERIRRVCKPFRFEKMPAPSAMAVGILILVLTVLGVGLAAGWLASEVFQVYTDWVLKLSTGG